MHEVRDKTTYFFVDRSRDKTYYIGDFNELIVFLTKHIHFENLKLKAPKSQYNNFGKYNYRNCEDILEAVKPLLNEHKLVFERYFDWHTEKFITGWHYKDSNYLAARPYMIVNNRGSVIDFRKWEKLIVAARDKMCNYPAWGTTEGAEYGDKLRRYRYSDITYTFRSSPVPYVHKYKHWCHRPHKGLLNTIRNADSIRPKARIDCDYWDNFAHTDKCWKTNSKCRYQWQKNLKGVK